MFYPSIYEHGDIFSSGSRGVSEVSTETPFCCDCIIAHIARTRAQLTYCRFHAGLPKVSKSSCILPPVLGIHMHTQEREL